MRRLAGRLVTWLMRRRSSLPRWVNRLMESAAKRPDGLVGRLAAGLLGSGGAPTTTVPDRPLRVYVGPTNYAGQGYAWARALEAADERVGARNVAVELPGGFAFRADTLVPIAAVNGSSDWAEAEWEAARRFTHVLVEAERSLFGRRFGRSLPAEVTALEDAGVAVAFLCHGRDIRDPDRHAGVTPWSPYPEHPRTADLRAEAAANLALLTELGRPTFVSTPDLLDDVPWARWCPVVVDPARFATTIRPLEQPSLRIVHLSSSPAEKGSHFIEPALEPLVARGAVDYELITSLPSSEVPAALAEADIVIDQFRFGSYGVAACEAMAAGRLVLGHVLPGVRERVRADHGVDLPILEATPDTLRGVVESVLDDRDDPRQRAASGPDFVARVHDGTASARALLGWIDADRA